MMTKPRMSIVLNMHRECDIEWVVFGMTLVHVNSSGPAIPPLLVQLAEFTEAKTDI
jgi:hypothetical protein